MDNLCCIKKRYIGSGRGGDRPSHIPVLVFLFWEGGSGDQVLGLESVSNFFMASLAYLDHIQIEKRYIKAIILAQNVRDKELLTRYSSWFH